MLSARDLWAAAASGSEPVLRGVSLDVAPGEWVAITGPNGGGKSTLAMALAGLMPIRAGRVLWNGAPIGPGNDRLRRADIAVVLQEPGVQILTRSVGEEIGFTLAGRPTAGEGARERVERWAARLGIGGLGREPRSLSAGEQQAVLIAGALASGPRLLILDEAAAFLDAATRERVRGVLRDEVERGLALVTVTQDPAEARAADRILVIRDGTIGPALDDSRLEPTPAGSSARSSTREGDRSAIRVRVDPDTMGRIRTDRAIDFAIPARGIVALTGPNGCGKTALLSALAGVLHCTQVVIPEQLRRSSPLLASQYPEQQIFEERVEQEVVFAARARGVDRQSARARAAAMFASLGTGADIMARRTWSLSAGERRLVQLVATLIAPAGLFLLDEPTSSLDPERRLRLASVIVDSARETPIVTATQDLGWARGLGATMLALGSMPSAVGDAGFIAPVATPSQKTD